MSDYEQLQLPQRYTPPKSKMLLSYGTKAFLSLCLCLAACYYNWYFSCLIFIFFVDLFLGAADIEVEYDRKRQQEDREEQQFALRYPQRYAEIMKERKMKELEKKRSETLAKEKEALEEIERQKAEIREFERLCLYQEL
jgi:ABC-type transport system involved in cytochrome bd biosynthesis fused ATPase/permease subunit